MERVTFKRPPARAGSAPFVASLFHGCSPGQTNARKLLLEFEVGGGERYYNAALKHPTWPGVASGVTIGIGWDAGYNSAATLRADWSALPEADVGRLSAVAGIKGAAAKAAAARVRDITVPWSVALDVFESVTLPKFARQTLQAFPGADKLHPDAFGALLSLVFNRGPSLSGDKRREMRQIASLVPGRDYDAIAAQIRAMKRLWPGVRGLLRRREAEAVLVESCEGKVAFRI